MVFCIRILCGFLLSAILLSLTVEVRQVSDIFAEEQIAYCDRLRSQSNRGHDTGLAPNYHSDSLTHDALVESNLELIRPRPRNLRLVFVGDSLTRYQYLSLAYFLRHGRWWDPSITVNNLVNAHSFRHPFHPNEDWNEFFFQSNRLLHPLEICDCERTSVAGSPHVSVERRYFHDKERNNTVVYINLSGNVTDDIRPEHYYGRVKTDGLWSQFEDLVCVLPPSASMPRVIIERDDSMTNRTDQIAWEYESWGEVMVQHLGGLELGTGTPVVLNAGLHPHQFHDSDAATFLKQALDAAGLRGLWKTTTYTKDEVTARNSFPFRTRKSDSILCQTLECFNISWTSELNPSLYDDQYHFHEPVYRILNEELLGGLGLLPLGYMSANRSAVLS